jgi:predicted secreted Zn-dependent protease
MTRTKRKLLAVVTLVATATSAHATVQVETNMSYYDVVGTTSAAIITNIKNVGPTGSDGKRNGWWGKTNWKINVNYYYRPDNYGCGFTSVTTILKVDIIMPLLVTDVSAKVHKWFDEQTKKLLTHEFGHRNVAVGTAEDIDAAVIKMRAATCKELISDVDKNFPEWMKKGNETQANYDVVTKHGLKQKAWPIAVNKKPVEPIEATPSSSPAKPVEPVEATPSSSAAILTWKSRSWRCSSATSATPKGRSLAVSRGLRGSSLASIAREA